MKKSRIFLIAILLFALASNSQISKGNWMMGGSADVGASKSTQGGISNSVGYGLYLNPNVGYFFIDKLAVGAKMGLALTKDNTNYGLGPFARYYFLEKEKPINIFSEISYEILRNNHSESVKADNFNIKGGAVFFLNSSVGLEVALNYAKQMTSDDYQVSRVFIGFGFQIHLEKK